MILTVNVQLSSCTFLRVISVNVHLHLTILKIMKEINHTVVNASLVRLSDKLINLINNV